MHVSDSPSSKFQSSLQWLAVPLMDIAAYIPACICYASTEHKGSFLELQVVILNFNFDDFVVGRK